MLKNRLQCVPNYWELATNRYCIHCICIDKPVISIECISVLRRDDQASIESQTSVDFEALIAHFQQVQRNHQQHRISQRRRKFPH